MKAVLVILMFVFLQIHGAEAAEPAQKPARYILLTPFVDYDFFDSVKKGMHDAASIAGVTAKFDGVPDGNVHALAEKVRRAAADGYDGIALNIVDPIAFDDAVSEAARRGVPIIAFNVDDAHTPNARLAAVGQNMLEAGREFGRRIQDSIPAQASVLLTMHDPNISALEDRAGGIQQTLKSKNITWRSLITGTDREKAIGKIKKALDENPSIRIVIGTGSADTEAAGLAIEKHFPGRGYSSAGFDVSPDILRLIKSGVIRFTVDQQPYAQGYMSVMMLELYRRTHAMPASIDTGATFITVTTAAEVEVLSSKHFR